MAKEAIAQLFRESMKDSSLRDHLNTAKNIQSFIQMAKQQGFEFTLDEWKAMTQFSVEEVEGKLSEIPGL